jgi:hypothetical protein
MNSMVNNFCSNHYKEKEISVGKETLPKDMEFIPIPLYKIVKALAREEKHMLEHYSLYSCKEERELARQIVSLERLAREIIGMGWIEKHKKELDKK